MAKAVEIQPRREVLELAKLMEIKLRANESKSHWSHCSYAYLLSRLFDELAEFGEQFLTPIARLFICGNLKTMAYGVDAGWFAVDSNFDSGEVLGEIADIANFLMMLTDLIKKRGETNDKR